MTRRPAGHARQADGSASGERMGLDLAVPLTAPPMGTQHLCSCFGAHVDKLPGSNGSLCSPCPSPSLCRASSPGSPGMLAPREQRARRRPPFSTHLLPRDLLHAVWIFMDNHLRWGLWPGRGRWARQRGHFLGRQVGRGRAAACCALETWQPHSVVCQRSLCLILFAEEHLL